MKPRFKTLTILVACAGTALCLLLFALQLFPDPESLPYLQEMVAEKGWCSVSVEGDDWIIQADTARIENDSLILKRNATTGDDYPPSLHSPIGFTCAAQRENVAPPHVRLRPGKALGKHIATPGAKNAIAAAVTLVRFIFPLLLRSCRHFAHTNTIQD
jgi:hypothetical protein